MDEDMLLEDRLAWIAAASYIDLLRAWRYTKMGSTVLHGESGVAFHKRFNAIRGTMTPEELAQASKEVGWDG